MFTSFSQKVLLLLALGTALAQAQTYNIVHFFTGGMDGALPSAQLTIDAAGNLYGTSVQNYRYGCGNVFQFTPNPDGSWTENVLTTFDCQASGGIRPYSSIALDAAGRLYGTTSQGGASMFGTVFQLTPNGDGTWTRTTIHDFAGPPSDGEDSMAGMVFDAAGNLYGETCLGGTANAGTVFELIPQSDGTWAEKILYSFQNGIDGGCPAGPLTLDGAGNNLYGTTAGGGNPACSAGCGTVFELQRSANWKESVLYAFTGGADGATPFAGVTWAQPDTLYGTTYLGGTGGSGTVFQLTFAGGAWSESVIHNFTPDDAVEGLAPTSGLLLDGSDLYGTTTGGGKAGLRTGLRGIAFKLSFAGGQWTEQVLHRFHGPPTDGDHPASGVALRRDSTGLHIFGTAFYGGPSTCGLGCGAVYEITE